MAESIDRSIHCSGVTSAPKTLDVDAVVIPVFGPSDGVADLADADAATTGELTRARASGEFRAGLYDVFVTRGGAPWKARRLVFVGAGAAADADAARMRRVGATAGYALGRACVESAAIVVRGVADLPAGARAFADGLMAPAFDGGTYKDASRASRPYRLRSLVVTAPGGDADAMTRAVREGQILGECANVSRGLANEPGNVLTPTEFASRVRTAAEAVGLTVEVLDRDQMDALGMHLLLGVSRGSAEAPRLVVIKHEPKDASADSVLGLVGKGVTFDTGGISLKPADSMDRMKDDMAGGAAVAGAMLALARLGGRHRVIGVIPMVENMPGGRAIRPGDVLRGASGRTVEIINTDAEGRLILADALWYARRIGATHLVDVATLTGACVVALGHAMSGLFGNQQAWVDVVGEAAAAGGDRVWQLPIYEEALEQMRSEIADLMNSGGRAGGAVTAAVFLREFAGDGPWAHLDIAGTAWAEKKEPYQPKGATGVAVRTLTALGLSGGAMTRR